MRDQTTFTLSTTRGTQLREIATRRGMKVSDLIGSWIIREFEEQGEPSLTPDVDIKVVHDEHGVHFLAELFNEHVLTLTVEQSRSLGSSFEHAIVFGAKRKAGYELTDFDAAKDGLKVGRRGAAVVFEDGAYRKTMPLGTAREIAQELIEAADQYGK